jgi:hypothetical protein
MWEDTSFLEHCSPAVARLYAYWDSKRRGRPMPSRGDLDPVEMREWLGRIMLYDVIREDPLDFRYRLIGSHIVHACGADLTSHRISEQTVSADREGTLRGLREIAQRRTLRFRNDLNQGRQNLFTGKERIFLPLSEGTETEMILFYFHDMDLHHDGRDEERGSSALFGPQGRSGSR